MKKIILLMIFFLNLLPVLKEGELSFTGPSIATAQLYGDENGYMGDGYWDGVYYEWDFSGMSDADLVSWFMELNGIDMFDGNYGFSFDENGNFDSWYNDPFHSPDLTDDQMDWINEMNQAVIDQLNESDAIWASFYQDYQGYDYYDWLYDNPTPSFTGSSYTYFGYSLTTEDLNILSQMEQEDQFVDHLLTNPSNCYGTDRIGNKSFPGTLEHWLIQCDYISKHQLSFMEYSIPGTSASGYRGFADIANVKTGEIFEIKPDNPTGIAAGRAEVEIYVSKARIECPNPYVFNWYKGNNYPKTTLPWPLDATKSLEARLAEDGVIVYTLKPRNTNPSPVAVPQRIADKIKVLVQRLVQNPTNIEEQIIAYLRLPENKEIADFIKAAAVGSAIGIVIGTIAEDFVTAGWGIADDWASFKVAYDLVRLATKI